MQNVTAGLFPVDGGIVTADFNGDGRDEIAALMSDYQTVAFYSVDPSSFAITQTTSVKLPYQFVAGQATIAAGVFRANTVTSANLPSADAVVIGQLTTGSYGYSLIPIQVTPGSNGSFTAAAVSPHNQPLPPGYASNGYYQFPDRHDSYGVLAQAAPLASWPQQVSFNGESAAGTIEQLVIGFQTQSGTSYIEIGTFETDNSLTFDWDGETGLNYSGTQLISMQIGNFDSQTNGTQNGWQLETYSRDGIYTIHKNFQCHSTYPKQSVAFSSGQLAWQLDQ